MKTLKKLKWLKRKKDERVTAKVSLKDCGIIFAALIVVSGFHMLIYVTIQDQDRVSPMFIINALIGWLFFSSTVLTVLYWFVRHFGFERPMRRLSEAAKKIAAGDFGVRVAPLPRKRDGKKDYFDVMIDDFNTMTEELAGIESMKNDFIANVSHEIKTPISIIQNYALAMQDEAVTSEERSEYIKTIVGASQRLSNLVTNILKLNKLEHQEIIPEAVPFDLSEQLRKCALAFEDLWEQKAIRFSADLDDSVAVAYNESMLELVWNNLLSNAIKFTDDGGTISLSLKVHDGFVLVSVQDSGCGMDEKTVRHIFDKFYQGDSSHSVEGNGLGLAMVKKVLEIIDGEIRVESKPGEGTRFTVSLRTGDSLFNRKGKEGE
jgi:signal transduction histidine kinase